MSTKTVVDQIATRALTAAMMSEVQALSMVYAVKAPEFDRYIEENPRVSASAMGLLIGALIASGELGDKEEAIKHMHRLIADIGRLG